MTDGYKRRIADIMTWKRARRPEQKQERKDAILDAAAALYDREGLEKASLNAIAREAGISKANIYRYFESREEIFLHLVKADYQKWVTSVERALAPLAGSDDERAVARELVSTVNARPRFASLISVIATVLERNITVEKVVWFKTAVLETTLRLSNSIQAAMPGLNTEQIRLFMLNMQLLLIGIWPASHPPSAVRKALERPELAHACIDFERDLTQALITAFRGVRVCGDDAS
jgi:AcrR family transcriptional regulator